MEILKYIIEIITSKSSNEQLFQKIGKIEKQVSSDGLQILDGGADQVLLPRDWDYSNWVKSIVDKQTGKAYTFEDFKEVFPNIITK